MNVQQISSINCKANPLAGAKKLNIPLKDGKEAVLKLNDKAYECLILNNGKIAGGRGQYSSEKIQPQDWAKLFKQLNEHVKEGFDFAGEFIQALLTQ